MKYMVQQFNSQKSKNMLLGCWVRQTGVLKHFWTCSNLHLHEPQTSHSFLSSRRSSTCPWYTDGGKMSDKNPEQQINIKFCVKIGKSASETLALLTLANGEYTMKKSSVFEQHRKGEKMCKTNQEVGSQKRKGQMQMWTEYETWCAQIDD